jgi:hypothetical protein
LDRAANDLSTIVQYGREIELKTQPGLDLQKVLRGISAELNLASVFDPEQPNLTGNFDPTQLTEALKWISVGALKYQPASDDDDSLILSVSRSDREGVPLAVVQWNGPREWDHDPFHSFVGSDEIRMSLAAKIIGAHGRLSATLRQEPRGNVTAWNRLTPSQGELIWLLRVQQFPERRKGGEQRSQDLSS